MSREASAAEPAPVPLWRRIAGSTLFQLVLAFVVFGLVLNFIAKPYVIPSGSMEQTLEVSDRVVVNRLAYLGGEPQTGDVIVFDAATAWDGERPSTDGPIKAALRWVGEVSGFGPSGPHTLIKRVIGAPGQTVECCSAEGAVLVDGVALDEPYIYEDLPFVPGQSDCSTTPISPRCFPEVTVPQDAFFMLGDHRGNSSDSAANCRGRTAAEVEAAACWRWAERDGIVGKAAFIFWPIGNWSGIR